MEVLRGRVLQVAHASQPLVPLHKADSRTNRRLRVYWARTERTRGHREPAASYSLR